MIRARIDGLPYRYDDETDAWTAEEEDFGGTVALLNEFYTLAATPDLWGYQAYEAERLGRMVVEDFGGIVTEVVPPDPEYPKGDFVN